MYSQFAASVRGDVCEIGPGVGTFSQRILDAGVNSLHLVEPSEEATDHLRGRFGSDPRVSVVSELLPGAPSMRPESFDFVLAQNVLEHIEDDGGAAAEVAASLRPAGASACWCPRTRGCTPRWTPPTATTGATPARGCAASWRAPTCGCWSCTPSTCWASPAGGPRRWPDPPSLDTRSLSVYEQLVRVWRPVEDRLSPRWGLSLIAIAEKPA